jgi:hypothetical protein
MKSLFIVTSAIHTSYGKCSAEERIFQTKKTLESINNFAPNSSTVIIDCGEKSVSKDLFNCDLIDYTKNQKIQFHLQKYLKNNKDIEPDIIIKSMLEIMMIEDYLKNNFVSFYDRIFKISGRYVLNSKFNYFEHLEAKNKVMILTPHRSQHLYDFNVNVSPLQYMTRLWSFDSILLQKILEVYSKMKDEIIRISESEKQGDIEHLFYKHLNKKYVKHVEIIGIEGYWAPLKLWIEE